MFKVRGAVDPGDGIAFVEIPLSGQKKQVVPRLDSKRLALHNTGFVLGVNFYSGFEALLVGHGQQPHIGLVKPTGHLIGGHGNLLHQPHLVGVHRGQAVEKVDFLSVGGRIPQHTQGMQGGNGLLGLGGVVYALGFVNDDDRVCVLDEPHGRLAAQLVLGLVDDVLRLLKGIDVDDHHFNVGAGGKLAHIGQLGGVVDEVPTGYIVILKAEMLLGNLEGLIHALPNGHRRHHDNELGEAILAVQLKDGLGVDIGFACAGLHLNAELHGFGGIGQGQVIPLLNRVHICGHSFRGYVKGISLAPVAEQRHLPLIHHRKGALGFLLASEQVHHGIDRIGLEVLLFEL